MLPSIEWAEKEYSGQLKVVKVEADANKGLVEKYKASLHSSHDLSTQLAQLSDRASCTCS